MCIASKPVLTCNQHHKGAHTKCLVHVEVMLELPTSLRVDLFWTQLWQLHEMLTQILERVAGVADLRVNR